MRLPIQVQIIVFRKVNNSYEFLLLKRIPEKGGFWQAITGGLEDGESIERAIMREIKEESQITEIKRLIKKVDFHQFESQTHKEPKGIWLSEFVFGAEVDKNTEVNISNNIYKEHTEFKWCTFEEALELLKWDSNKESLEKLNNILINKTLL